MKKELSEIARIKFVDNFRPDRINGSKEECLKLGIDILSGKSKDSGWDYEFPKIKINKDKIFHVKLYWNEEKDCCDILLSSQVSFAYVNKEDIIFIETKKENEMSKKSDKSEKKTVVMCYDYTDRLNSIYARRDRLYNYLFMAYEKSIDKNDEFVKNIKNDIAEINKEYEEFVSNFEIYTEKQ